MRVYTASTRHSLQSHNFTDLLLVFAVITHPNLGEPVRVVTEDVNGVSFSADGKPINYKYESKLYYALPFTFQFLSDDDNPPSSKLAIQNVDLRIGEAINRITTPAQFSFTVLKLSDFNTGVALDSDNAYSPTGTPEVLYRAPFLWLRNVTGTDDVITADIKTLDIDKELATKNRITSDRVPAVYV